jgi:hypothetical protein
MYVLCKLEKRAETTDTLLLLTSKNSAPLEEILLSIFDEIFKNEMYIASKNDDYGTEESIRKWCIEMMKKYQIIYVPYID